MTEIEVIKYIEENPDFFSKNPELIHKIQLNYSKFKTSSLVEKRISNLTIENNSLKKSAYEILSISKENVELSKKIHLFTLKMLQKTTFNEFIDYLLNEFISLFNFDEVKLLSNNAFNNNVINLEPDNKVLKFLNSNKIYYGTKQQYHLNSICDPNIHSIAMINIGRDDFKIIILIGSKNKLRFTPDKDQFFIKNLQQIMEYKFNEFKK